MFLLKRNSDGKYVAPAGSAKSYTTSIKAAQKFPTRADAEQNACGNESVVPLHQEITT